MHTKHAEMNTSGETCIDSVPLPEPEFMTHLGNEAYTADQLRAYGDERARALRAELVESMNAEMQARRERDNAVASVAELESLLRMIATRAQTFPDFPIGWHIPEVFNAVGMQMPEPPENDDTHDGLRARAAELEAKLAEAEKDARRWRVFMDALCTQVTGGNHPLWTSAMMLKRVPKSKSAALRSITKAVDAAIAAGGGDA